MKKKSKNSKFSTVSGIDPWICEHRHANNSFLIRHQTPLHTNNIYLHKITCGQIFFSLMPTVSIVRLTLTNKLSHTLPQFNLQAPQAFYIDICWQ